MDSFYSPTTEQPMIVKFIQTQRNAIQSHNYVRHAIGYVIRGRKYIYDGDLRQEVNRGEMFYLSSGNHYTEEIPEDNKPFEQIVFYYSPEKLGKILANLSMNYNMDIVNDHSCPNCHEQNHVICPAWNAAKTFFNMVNQSIREGDITRDKTLESMKMLELIYLILTEKDCCFKTKILENTDSHKENFEQIIHRNIFNDISIEALAQQCNRSLTSFKKEFKKHFFEPPHKWFIRQRLMHSRLLLISTSKSISEIGNECNFPNTSHFIKLFKKEFGMTPAAYRTNHNESRRNQAAELKPKDDTQVGAMMNRQ
ncbi:MAG: AraC family transcriptional regulator [Alistipes sp.]|nr:AraC family transcriptional regulator [Alistipes sp.]